MKLKLAGTALLRLRLSLILVAVTVAMMVAVAAFVGRQVEQTLLRGAASRVEEENRLVRGMVAAYYATLLRSAHDLSLSFTPRLPPPYRRDPGTAGVPQLRADGVLLNGRHDELDAFTFDSRGQGALTLVRNADGFLTIASSLRQEDGSRDFSLRLLPGEPEYQGLSAGKAVTGQRYFGKRHLMLHFVPLRNDGGAVIGALGVAMDLEEPLATLKAMIGSVKIGATGYAYVVDARPGPALGKLLVHPAQEGANILAARDADGREFVRDMLAARNGLVAYSWRNEALGETVARDKIAAYAYVPELDWLVGSGTYVDELTGIADEVRRTLALAAALVAAALIVVLNLAIGRWVVKPLLAMQRRLQESDERWTFAVEGSGDGVWDWRLDSGEIYFSDRWRDMLGYAPGEVAPSADQREALIHPDDLPAVRERIARHVAGEVPDYRSEHRMRHRQGGYLWVMERGKVVSRDRDGRASRLIGTQTDISQRRQAEEERRLWANIFADSTEGIVITDADNRIVSVNRAFETITGYASAEVVGHHPGRFNVGRQDDAFYNGLRAALATSGRWQGEVQNRRKDGTLYPATLFVTTVRDGEGRVVNRVGILSDISDRKSAEAQVEYLAHHDMLTGLGNRAGLQERLASLFAGAPPAVALVAIGLDRLKDINESLGHQAGDEVLRAVAGRLQHRLRAPDVLARLSGDEFVVVFAAAGGADAVLRRAQGLAEAIAEPCRIAEMDLRITASLGISLCPEDAQAPDALLRNAEAAMHSAKEQGRGRVLFFTLDLNERTAERLLMENQLRQALVRDELRLVYQPQVCLASGRLLGVEALLRWQSPAGPVSPAKFIPLAEQSELIVSIGEWVLREACRQQRAWQAAGLPVIPMAVNISSVQFHQPGFPALVAAVLQEAGVAAGNIELEVTESVMLADAGQAIAVFRQLKEQGLRLAIDDFGTGYSSMSYLRHFPVDRLKIDQSFIRGADNRLAEDAIVRTIIALGENLALRVLAEGVESAEQAARLRQHGCHEAQGFYFARPLAADELPGWYAATAAA